MRNICKRYPGVLALDAEADVELVNPRAAEILQGTLEVLVLRALAGLRPHVTFAIAHIDYSRRRHTILAVDGPLDTRSVLDIHLGPADGVGNALGPLGNVLADHHFLGDASGFRNHGFFRCGGVFKDSIHAMETPPRQDRCLYLS